MEKFDQLKTMYIKKLEQYVPIVAKVHGAHHPEFHKVHQLFEKIHEKVQEVSARPDLEEEFTELREVTRNYKVPDDVCETFEAVYKMLEELDKAYFN